MTSKAIEKLQEQRDYIIEPAEEVLRSATQENNGRRAQGLVQPVA